MMVCPYEFQDQEMESVIDLTIALNILAPNVIRTIFSDSMALDHFPITIGLDHLPIIMELEKSNWFIPKVNGTCKKLPGNCIISVEFNIYFIISFLIFQKNIFCITFFMNYI